MIKLFDKISIALIASIILVALVSFSSNDYKNTKYAMLKLGRNPYVLYEDGKKEFLKDSLNFEFKMFDYDNLFLEKVKVFKYLNAKGYKIQSGTTNDFIFLFIKE